MTPVAWIVVAIVVIAVAAAAAILWSRGRRSAHLKDRFGPEYDRAVEAKGNRGKAEAELAEREKRVEKLDIRQLTPDERREFGQRWTDVQARFVTFPPERSPLPTHSWAM